MKTAVIAATALFALLAAAAPGAAAAVAPARFNPASPENRQVIPAFGYATVEPVLAQIGARYQRSGAAGSPALLVSFPNNRKAVLVFGACAGEASGCKSLSIQSHWTPIANSPADRTARAIESFNRRFSFAKAYVGSDGRPSLQRYLTADYGFLRGNLAVNLLVFANQADRFATEVLRPLEAG